MLSIHILILVSISDSSKVLVEIELFVQQYLLGLSCVHIAISYKAWRISAILSSLPKPLMNSITTGEADFPSIGTSYSLAKHPHNAFCKNCIL